MSSIQQQWVDQVSGVLETLNQGVIINDQQRRVVYANSMALEMIGLRLDQLLGRSVADLFPPENIPRLLEFIGRRESESRARRKRRRKRTERHTEACRKADRATLD